MDAADSCGHDLKTPACCTEGLVVRCTSCGKTYGIWQHPHKRRSDKR